jgi:hypothetical protein
MAPLESELAGTVLSVDNTFNVVVTQSAGRFCTDEFNPVQKSILALDQVFGTHGAIEALSVQLNGRTATLK